MRGRFDVARTCVVLEGGREVSPTEFERLAGKAASKKWKASIRVDKVRAPCALCPLKYWVPGPDYTPLQLVATGACSRAPVVLAN